MHINPSKRERGSLSRAGLASAPVTNLRNGKLPSRVHNRPGADRAAASGWPLVIVVFILLMAGCGEAPRDNPLDPQSPDFNNTGTVRIHAQRFYAPHQPLAEVALLISPPDLVRLTDSNGTFTLTEAAVGTLHVIASKPGFEPDTQHIVIKPRALSEAFMRLNAKPVFEEVAVRSEHLSVWTAIENIYFMLVDASLDDADGKEDIVAVTMWSERFGKIGDLERGEARGDYHLQLRDDRLKEFSLFDLVGDRLWLEARDQPGTISVSPTVFLSRIIETTPTAKSPFGQSQVSSRPQFYWDGGRLSFRHSFRIDIDQIDENLRIAIPFDQRSGIPADSTSWQWQNDLPTATYKWTISIVDELGNLSRSKDASFQVTQ